MAIIYKIENRITNEVYIGQTVFKLTKRWKQHIREANEALNGTRQSFPLFHRMIIKYGADNFIPSVLEECDKSLLDEREQYWIEYYKSYESGYNSTIGGQNLNQTEMGFTKINHPHTVSQFDSSGNYIKTFSSAQEAAEAVHVDASNIRKIVINKVIIVLVLYGNGVKIKSYIENLVRNIVSIEDIKPVWLNSTI